MRLLVLVVALAAPFSAAVADSATALQTQALQLDALPPAMAPHVLADPAGRRFLLSWLERLPERCHALQAAELSAEGRLGEVREIARGCDWFANWADHPRLALADNGDWLAFWLQKQGSGVYHYGIRLSRSRDQGRTWSAAISPHGREVAAEHGFMSMAALGEDRMLLLWLDGRHTAAAEAQVHAGHNHEGPMSLRSAVVDGEGGLSDQAELDARVCSCCATDLVRTGPQQLQAVVRDRNEDEIRDIARFEYADGRWQSRGLVHEDGWKIGACPVNGPALAASGTKALAAWSTMPAEGVMAVRARLLDAGAPMQEIERGEAVQGRIDAADFAGGYLLSWLGANAANKPVLRLGWFDAALGPLSRHDVQELPPGRAPGSPRLASLGERAVLVWTEPQPAIEGRPQSRVRGVLIRAQSAD